MPRVAQLVEAERALECRVLPALVHRSVRQGRGNCWKGMEMGEHKEKGENYVLIKDVCTTDFIISLLGNETSSF